jgi:hypothetical protein
MYFGGTILTFALPMGAFIAAAVALFYLFRAQHREPRLKYMTGAAFSSFGTREPGPVPAPPVAAAAPETEAVVAPETAAVPETAAAPETEPQQETATQETTTDPGTAQATEETEE